MFHHLQRQHIIKVVVVAVVIVDITLEESPHQHIIIDILQAHQEETLYQMTTWIDEDGIRH
jgi:hypothetical protein